MTEFQETFTSPTADQCHLLHLSTISFRTKDVVSVEWGVVQAFSKRLTTKIRTKYQLFILYADTIPEYQNDIDLLEQALYRQSSDIIKK